MIANSLLTLTRWYQITIWFRLHCLTEKKVHKGDKRRIRRMEDHLYSFPAIWMPGLRWHCGLGLPLCRGNSPGMTTWDFFAWKSAWTKPGPSWCTQLWRFHCWAFWTTLYIVSYLSYFALCIWFWSHLTDNTNNLNQLSISEMLATRVTF